MLIMGSDDSWILLNLRLFFGIIILSTIGFIIFAYALKQYDPGVNTDKFNLINK